MTLKRRQMDVEEMWYATYKFISHQFEECFECKNERENQIDLLQKCCVFVWLVVNLERKTNIEIE